MILLLGFMFPLICYGTFFYRVYMFNMQVKTACQVGAAQPDLASAKTAIANYIAKTKLVGINLSIPAGNITTVTRATKFNVPTGPSAGNQTYDVYYLQVSGDGQIDPLLPIPNFFGKSIPGMAGPLPVNMTTQVYFENQQAIVSGS
ncbi:MAG TPA: hypothetical protein V6C76_03295 [Drouetiella sp.]